MKKFPTCNKLKDFSVIEKQNKDSEDLYPQFNDSSASDLVKKAKK